jgi:hypothetical protein
VLSADYDDIKSLKYRPRWNFNRKRRKARFSRVWWKY